MVVSLRILKKETFTDVFRTLPNVYDEFFFQKQLMSFNVLLFSQKSSAKVVRHNPTYASDIFLTIFTAVLLDCLEQTFRTAIFQDVSEDLILSYNLISLFPSI